MKEEKKTKATKEQKAKKGVEARSMISAYNIIMAPKNEKENLPGFILSELDKVNLFKVLRANKIFKKIALDFEDFKNDVRERLKPSNWDDLIKKIGNRRLDEIEPELRSEIATLDEEYSSKVNECIETELEKVIEDDYERISEEAFHTLVKSNNLDADRTMILMEVLI